MQQIDVRSEHFRRVQLHRNNRIYGFLLHVCEFVHEHWLPTEEGRGRHFRDFARNGLPKVFERFVLNFYKRELPDWDVGAPWIDWSADGQNALSRELLPVMKTDVCLSRPGRAIILDTKFYAEALKAGPYGTPKLLSGNLYQMYTYLRQKSCDPGWESAEGVLLYPRTSRDLDAEFSTHGHRIRAVTLNLWQPWQAIHGDLLNIVIQETPPQSPTLQNPP